MLWKSALEYSTYEHKAVLPWSGPNVVKEPASLVVTFSSLEYLPRLRNLLVSVQGQKHVDPTSIEIVLNHVKAQSEDLSKLSSLASSFDAVLHSTHAYYTEGKFPRSAARNIGGRKATHDTMIFVDADMVLDPEALCRTLSLKQSIVLIKTSCLEREQPVERLLGGGVESFRDEASKLHVTPGGVGGFLALPREVLYGIGGYDEAYDVGWGAEDADILDRATEFGKSQGVQLRSLSDETGLLNMHQWHPRNDRSSPIETALNVSRYYANEQVVANGGPIRL